MRGPACIKSSNAAYEAKQQDKLDRAKARGRLSKLGMSIAAACRCIAVLQNMGHAQIAGKVFSMRAYEEACWHHESQNRFHILAGKKKMRLAPFAELQNIPGGGGGGAGAAGAAGLEGAWAALG